MDTLTIIITTILAYQVLNTIIYLISGENEDVLTVLGLGVPLLFIKTISAAKRYFDYRNVVTLLTDPSRKKLYYCSRRKADSYLGEGYCFPKDLNEDELNPLVPKELRSFGKINLRYIPLKVAKNLGAERIK